MTMARLAPQLLLLLLGWPELGWCSTSSTSSFSRDDFPPGFVFGAGTSAYQVEGAAAEGGRAPSIWDTHTHAGKMVDGSTGDVTADQYHKYKEDVKLMKETGLEAYRFSISWCRLIPKGRGDVNPEGLAYYNNLINELLEHGIQPHVTLYHLDLPQALEDEYHGWLSPRIVDDFAAYADVCFREFGDRVSLWTTINEPNAMALGSYDNGILPPARCSPPFGLVDCKAGNSTVEPYIAVHHALLAHAAVAQLYRTKYQAAQKGWIGVNVYTLWCYPLTNSSADADAAGRALHFFVGWILNPLVFGDYPEVMRKMAGSRLPSFTESQSKQVKGSFDFLGLNHYTSVYTSDNPQGASTHLRDIMADMSVMISVAKNDTQTGQFVPTTVPVDPPGMQNILEYITRVYGAPPIYVQENGYGDPYNSSLSDIGRRDALKGFIGGVLAAIRNGSRVRGYLVWSFLDVFGVLSGFTRRWGIYHVDFEDDHRRRRPKLSARWYQDFLKSKERIHGFTAATQASTSHPPQ